MIAENIIDACNTLGLNKIIPISEIVNADQAVLPGACYGFLHIKIPQRVLDSFQLPFGSRPRFRSGLSTFASILRITETGMTSLPIIAGKNTRVKIIILVRGFNFIDNKVLSI